MDKKAYLTVKEFKKEIEKDLSIDVLIFFGSRTTNHYQDDSDIDLIIVSDKFRGVDFFDRGLNLYDHWKTGYPVDFICFTPEEFNERKNRFSIVSEALANGIAV
ncbi:MAG: nucleotidyltransferase [Thermoplasmata archaeon HGW-Thermoplasmata-1]|nr:MAG: nucleotidyltransferase [Thermoplasmata archaeon HGW-Thermoplasmata-1]